MSQEYIKDGMLQPCALMDRELAGKMKIECPPLSLPQSSGQNTTGKATTNFPYDYYSAPLSGTYPDGNTDKTFYFPGVYVYNAPRTVGNTTRYPLGFSKGFVAYFEPCLKRGYDSTIFGDRRFSQTPDITWTESRIYHKDDGNNSGGLQVTASGINKKSGKRYTITFDDLNQAFSRANGAVALRVNLTCSMKLQAQVSKGKPLPDNAEARPVIIPSQMTILGPADIPEPVVTSGRRTQTSEKDDADESFMDMLMQQNEDDDDAEEDDEDEEE